MTTTRKSSRSHASAATTNAAEPETVSHNTVEQTDGSSFPSAVDSTHQASEASHLKQDQKLEASDPDLVSPTGESLTADQLDAATTPIDAEIQEEEAASVESSSQAQDHQKDHKEPEHAKEAVEDKELSHAGGDIKSHDDDDDVDDDVDEDDDDATHMTESGVDDAALSHLDAAPPTDDQIEQPHDDGLEATKHFKRPVEQDSNTVAEEEHDYIAGSYKSPFRHTHKAERAGKEER